MAPAPPLGQTAPVRLAGSVRALYIASTMGLQYVARLGRFWLLGDIDNSTTSTGPGESDHLKVLHRRTEGIDRHDPKFIVFVVLIPVLVLLSGLFAGLTLGYMSLDETQLNVLSVSGTPEQREYANRIKPIRENGHRLLVTLLLANMIVNETLPVIADPVLGGGVPGVVMSTVLIVIFAEIIPQSLFSRHGLYLGAKMAGLTTCLLYGLAIIAWPIAKFLELVLGNHHGLIYRRAELKELIAMHSASATHGGDLKADTVNIIGATLDLQEKVVKQIMTDIKDVFMLSIDAKLDYTLLKQICETGHSRVPVYEEVDIPLPPTSGDGASSHERKLTHRVRRIVGILLVKTCVLLDPKEAIPIRDLPLNKVPFVAGDEPLLGILNKFQEGRSHMAIVSRLSIQKAESVTRIVRREITNAGRELLSPEGTKGATQGLQGCPLHAPQKQSESGTELTVISTKDLKAEPSCEVSVREVQSLAGTATPPSARESQLSAIKKTSNFLEQALPSDAILSPEDADHFLQNFDPAIMPLGIVTLEDVLEELIGEEIYDEFDTRTARILPFPLPPKRTKSAPAMSGQPGDNFFKSDSAATNDTPAEPSTRVIQSDTLSLNNLCGSTKGSRSQLLVSDLEDSPLSSPSIPSLNVRRLHSGQNSPAPSIETKLLNCQRRLEPGVDLLPPDPIIRQHDHSSSPDAKPPPTLIKRTSAAKGTKFKSTPLSPSERGTGSSSTSRHQSPVGRSVALEPE